MPFDALVDSLISAFLALALFGIGLSATFRDMAQLLADRTRLFPALAANVLCPPVVALGLIWLIPMEPAAATVLLLLAFLPGGINAVQFSTKAPGQLAAAGELLFVLSGVALVLAPIVAQVLLEPEGPISLPWGGLLLRIGGFVLLPMLLGMWLRSAAPDWAEKLYKPAMLISTLCFIASVVISLGLRQEALAALGSGAAVAMLAFVLIMMAVGWFLGGPDPDSRQVLAVTTNLRNVGLAYLLVDNCCDDPLLPAAVLAYMAIMVTPNLLLTVGCGVARKRRVGISR
jgi:BASS family bile acid:Na+ symporter